MIWGAVALALLVGLAAWIAGWGPDPLLGIVGPAAAVAGSWMVMTRTWAQAPATLLPVMIRAFVAKCLFFLAYVTVALKGFEARPEPFVAGLVGSFVMLYGVEAWALKRLMHGTQGN